MWFYLVALLIEGSTSEMTDRSRLHEDWDVDGNLGTESMLREMKAGFAAAAKKKAAQDAKVAEHPAMGMRMGLRTFGLDGRACNECEPCVRECGSKCAKQTFGRRHVRERNPEWSLEIEDVLELEACVASNGGKLKGCAGFSQNANKYVRCTRECAKQYWAGGMASEEALHDKMNMECCHQTCESYCGGVVNSSKLTVEGQKLERRCLSLCSVDRMCPAVDEGYSYNLSDAGVGLTLQHNGDEGPGAGPRAAWNTRGSEERLSLQAELSHASSAESQELAELGQVEWKSHQLPGENAFKLDGPAPGAHILADIKEMLAKAPAMHDQLDKAKVARKKWYLAKAVAEGDVSNVRKALAAGHDVNVQEPSDGSWPLLRAAGLDEGLEERAAPIVELLLKHGADVHATARGMTALHSCAHSGNTEACAMLLAAGADPDVRDDLNDSPLDFAVDARVNGVEGHGHPEIVSLLIENGVELDSTGQDGMTALMLAAYRGNARLVKMLIDAGAALQLTSDHDATALDYAESDAAGQTITGHAKAARLLRQAAKRPMPKRTRGNQDEL
jgi:hypothetical protein